MGERTEAFHDRPRPPLVRVGDHVRVKAGPHRGQAGKVVYRSSASVHVDLGRPVPAVVKLDAIEAEGMPDRWGSPGGRTYEVDRAAEENLKKTLAEKEQEPAPEPETESNDEPAEAPEKETPVGYKRDPSKFDDLTAEDVARWARLRREGKSYKWIQENDELHPSGYALAKYLPEYGYDTKGRPVDGADPEPEAEPAKEERQDAPEPSITVGNPEAIPGLVGTSYIADELNVDEDTVTRHIREGNLAAQKVGAKWAIARADADAFIEAYLEPEPEEEPAPLATGGNGTAVTEQNVDRQLAAVQQLMATLQAGSVQVSGRLRLELAVEVEL